MLGQPKKRADVSITETPEGFIARRPGSNVVTWLNRTGYMVFELCTGNNDVETIAAALVDAFDLWRSPRIAVQNAIAELVAAGLVDPGEAPQFNDLHLTVYLWSPTVSTDVSTVAQVIELQNELRDSGVPVEIVIEQDQNMRRAKNRALSSMLHQTSSSHILLLDMHGSALLTARMASLRRLMMSGHHVIGLPIQIGLPNWEKVKRVASTDPDVSPPELEALAHGYEVSFYGLPGPKRIVDGYIEAATCGTAAMLVSRFALERLAGSGYVERNRGVTDLGRVSTRTGWGFLNPALTNEGISVSEDAAFCERLRASGSRVMVDTTGGFGQALTAARRSKRNSS